MQKILRTYFQKFKFKHPSTADFQRVVEQVTKTKWHDYFSRYVYGNQMADFSIESIHVRPVTQDGNKMYESVVLVKKNGGSNGDIKVVLQFTDGTKITKLWNAEETHIQFKQLHSAPLDWAIVDPNYSNVLDNKLINNYMQAQLPEDTRARWSLGVVNLIEGLLGSLSW
jgi:aminopeptidase N